MKYICHVNTKNGPRIVTSFGQLFSYAENMPADEEVVLVMTRLGEGEPHTITWTLDP